MMEDSGYTTNEHDIRGRNIPCAVPTCRRPATVKFDYGVKPQARCDRHAAQYRRWRALLRVRTKRD